MSAKAAAGQSIQRCISLRPAHYFLDGSKSPGGARLRKEAVYVNRAKNITAKLAQRRGGVLGRRWDASDAGVHARGSQSYQDGSSLSGSSQRNADVSHVQVLHRRRRQRLRRYVHGRVYDGNDGSRRLPTGPRQDKSDGLVRPVCSPVRRRRDCAMGGDCCGPETVFEGLSADYKRRLWLVIGINASCLLSK
jgi:hypothetical protein